MHVLYDSAHQNKDVFFFPFSILEMSIKTWKKPVILLIFLFCSNSPTLYIECKYLTAMHANIQAICSGTFCNPDLSYGM